MANFYQISPPTYFNNQRSSKSSIIDITQWSGTSCALVCTKHRLQILRCKFAILLEMKMMSRLKKDVLQVNYQAVFFMLEMLLGKKRWEEYAFE